jgi:hypothetical protein
MAIDGNCFFNFIFTSYTFRLSGIFLEALLNESVVTNTAQPAKRLKKKIKYRHSKKINYLNKSFGLYLQDNVLVVCRHSNCQCLEVVLKRKVFTL